MSTETRPLKAFVMTDYEWWAHYSLEEAIAHYLETTGLSHDEAFPAEEDPPRECTEGEMGSMVIDEEEVVPGKREYTLREVLEMQGDPGFLCGSEV